MKQFSFLRAVAGAAALAVLLAGCAVPQQGAAPGSSTATQAAAPATPAIRQVLAPTGVLRVAMYRGSPSSFVQAGPSDAPRGVGYDLGRALAERLGVLFEPVVFANNAESLAAVKAGRADFTFTNGTPARAKDMDFSPGVLDVEKSVLVAGTSPLKALADLQRPGQRIGVSQGSSTAEELSPLYPQAKLLPVPTLQRAIAQLQAGELDAFATNNAILYEMGDQLPGSRVLPGRWGMEHFAVGIPKGRDAGRAFIADFVRQASADGTVQRAVARARLRGTVAPQP
ncbi:MAG: transporter substrate-binding domain-containing protein [Pseudomonadota bacterium]